MTGWHPAATTRAGVKLGSTARKPVAAAARSGSKRPPHPAITCEGGSGGCWRGWPCPVLTASASRRRSWASQWAAAGARKVDAGERAGDAAAPAPMQSKPRAPRAWGTLCRTPAGRMGHGGQWLSGRGSHLAQGPSCRPGWCAPLGRAAGRSAALQPRVHSGAGVGGLESGCDARSACAQCKVHRCGVRRGPWESMGVPASRAVQGLTREGAPSGAGHSISHCTGCPDVFTAVGATAAPLPRSGLG